MSLVSKRKCLATARLTTVWPSRFGSLKRCVLRESATAGKQLPLMPQSPRAAVGTAIHQLFERASTDPAFEISEASLSREWDKAMQAAEQFLSASEYMDGMLPIARSIPNLGLMRSRTFLRIIEDEKPQPRTPSPSKSGKKLTGKLASPSGLVVGVPDRIEGKAEAATIVDFKTGLSAETSPNSFQDYELQIKLYAALFHSCNGSWPKQLELHGLNGSVYVVPFTSDECTRLFAEAEQLATELATTTAMLTDDPAEQAKVASPSSVVCRLCGFRPACPAYLSASFGSSPPCEGDVFGTLRGWKTLGNGELVVELECRTGSARVRNLPPIAHITKALQSSALGQKIIVFNTVKSEETTPLHSPTAFTALHAYNEGDV